MTFSSHMNRIDFTIIQSSINNGRLYFENVPKDFFPADAIGGRSEGEHAPATVRIVAGSESFDTDIRVSSAIRLSPRRSFKLWLRAVKAADGGTAQLVLMGDRTYRLDYKG